MRMHLVLAAQRYDPFDNPGELTCWSAGLDAAKAVQNSDYYSSQPLFSRVQVGWLMRWLIDASYARHSGALTHQEGLLPALDARLEGDQCTILASTALANRLEGRLSNSDLEVLDVEDGFSRFASLNLAVRQRIRELRPAAVLCSQYAPLVGDTPYVLRVTDAHLVDEVGLRRVLPFYPATERINWKIKRAAFRWSTRRAHAVLCATSAVRDQLLKAESVDPSRVFTAHYGPSPLLRDAPRHKGVRGQRMLTMHASPRKNIESILHALARPELAGWTLTVLADLDRPRTRYLKFLADQIRALDLRDRVHSAGYIPERDTLANLMLDHDIFVNPSRIESWSHTVIEALGIGMPVIASDIACHQEVTGGAAWLVSCDDPAGLARATLEIMNDRDEVKRRVARGIDVVSQYSWDEYAKGAIAALGHAAGGKNRS